MSNKIKTRQITESALMCALYAVLLLVNMQTSLLVESSLPWIFTFPILVCTARTTVYMGCVSAAAMAVETLLFGGFTTWFYSWSHIVIGLGYGIGVKKGWSLEAKFVWTLVLCCLCNFCILNLWAGLFGMDYTQETALVQSVLPDISPAAVLIMVIAVISLLEAFCIVLMAQLLLVRLRIAPQAVSEFLAVKPSRTVGWICLGLLGLGLGLLVFKGANPLLENAAWVLLFLTCLVLDYYGILWMFGLSVRLQKRWLAAVAVLGAFIPLVQFIWIGGGLWSCLSAKK